MRPLIPIGLVALCACAPNGGELVMSRKARLAASAPAEDVARLASDNLDFGFDAYALIAGEESNFVFSPHSVSIALAMTWAGARGRTADEMAAALRFALEPPRLHAAFNSLDRALADPGGDVELSSVNQLWGQKGFGFEAPFLDALAQNYGAGMRLLDFAKEPEPSRKIINDWVAWHTKDKIRDLLPAGSVESLTRLVLTNAIYLNAPWKTEFDSARTRKAPFTLLDGSTASVDFMNASVDARVADGPGFRAIEIPYDGEEVGLLVVLPDAGRFAEIEGALDAEFVAGVAARLSEAKVALSLPKFTTTTAVDMTAILKALGMAAAFGDAADFSGITTEAPLFVSSVNHKAFIDVSEKGTEAAAATAVVVNLRSGGGPISMTVDHPFVYAVRHRETGAVLFLGRVLDPR